MKKQNSITDLHRYKQYCRQVATDKVPLFDAMQKVKRAKRIRFIRITAAACISAILLTIPLITQKQSDLDLNQKEQQILYAISTFSNQLNQTMDNMHSAELGDFSTSEKIQESILKQIEVLQKQKIIH